MLPRVAAECCGDSCQIRGQTVRVITSTRPIGRSLIEVKAESTGDRYRRRASHQGQCRELQV